MNPAVPLTPKWIFRSRPTSGVCTLLYCVSHAGGTRASFRHWAAGLPEGVEVRLVELPGHGSRIREEPLRRMSEISGELGQAIALDADRPFALYGHSMGGIVAFEAT